MSSWYLYKDKKVGPWQRLAKYDECGYFDGQYILEKTETPVYLPCAGTVIFVSWQEAFEESRHESIFLYIPDETVVMLLLTKFANVDRDYHHG